MPDSDKQKHKNDNLILRGTSSLPRNANLQYSEPLWKRVPTRDLKGQPYTDFMMLIPGLKHFELPRLQEIVDKLEAVLKQYEKHIIVADLNLKINVLWVTHLPHLGLSSEIAALIHHVVPEAKLVSQHTVQA